MTEPIKKTSNPIFTEGRDNHGVPPTPPRTDSMFDRNQQLDLTTKKPDNDSMAHGQKNTGHMKSNPNHITTPASNLHEMPVNAAIYFDAPGDYSPGPNTR